MKCVDRYQEHRDEMFDDLIMKLRNGTIKSGKYSHLVKVDEDKIMKGKEFFNDGKDDKSK